MSNFFKSVNWKLVVNVFVVIFSSLVIVLTMLGCYYLGFQEGYQALNFDYEDLLSQFNEERVSSIRVPLTPKPVSKESTPYPVKREINWSGPELWEAVNRARVENGVNPLQQKDELCTIASIRLNELLELGKLDAHEGFSNLSERRPDLKWIFEKYNISEFLIAGAGSAQEAVDLWFNTLGHKKIITGGEYVWGCTYAQNGFGVGISAFE